MAIIKLKIPLLYLQAPYECFFVEIYSACVDLCSYGILYHLMSNMNEIDIKKIQDDGEKQEKI